MVDISHTLRKMVNCINAVDNRLEPLDFRKFTQLKKDFRDVDPSILMKKIINGNVKADDAFYSYDINGNIIGFTDEHMRKMLYFYADTIRDEYRKLGSDKEGYLIMIDGLI